MDWWAYHRTRHNFTRLNQNRKDEGSVVCLKKQIEGAGARAGGEGGWKTMVYQPLNNLFSSKIPNFVNLRYNGVFFVIFSPRENNPQKSPWNTKKVYVKTKKVSKCAWKSKVKKSVRENGKNFKNCLWNQKSVRESHIVMREKYRKKARKTFHAHSWFSRDKATAI